MHLLMILGAVLAMMATWASAQDLYKCKAPDGRTIISNAPCAAGNDETAIPSAVSSPRATPSPSAVPSPHPATEERPPRPPVASNPTVDAAFKALRKIRAATDVGINMRDYGPLVVEAKSAVNDIVLGTPASQDAQSMQEELESAMQAYGDALTVFNLCLKDSRILKGESFLVTYGEGKLLNKKYKLAGIDEKVERSRGLSVIWSIAEEHLLRAIELRK